MKTYDVIPAVALIIVAAVMISLCSGPVDAAKPTPTPVPEIHLLPLSISFNGGNIGVFNRLYWVGYKFVDKNGKVLETNLYTTPQRLYTTNLGFFTSEYYKHNDIQLYNDVLDFATLKEAKLFFVLERERFGDSQRYDKFSVDLLPFVNLRGNTSYTFSSGHSFGWFKFDRLIFTDNYNQYRFPKTKKSGVFGEF